MATTIETTETQTSLRAAIEAGSHEIARHFGIHYFGDVNLIHGGFFYDSSNWDDHEYADAVSVDADDGHLFVTAGAVDRYNIDSALKCCGWKRDGNEIVDEHSGDIVADNPATIRLVEIEACKAHSGIESEIVVGENGYEQSSYAFPFVDWTESQFRAFGKIISVDDLDGWIVNRFLRSQFGR